MDDLRLVRQLWDRTPLVELDDLAVPRARLVVEIAAEMSDRNGSTCCSDSPAAGTARVWSNRRRSEFAQRSRFRSLWLQTALGAAAALALAAVTVQAAGIHSGRVGPGAAPASAGPAASNAVPLKLTAVEVLDRAAKQALTVPDVVPQSDQFVYTKTTLPKGGAAEDWRSVDGTHDGLTRISGKAGAEAEKNGEWPNPGCVNGRQATVDRNGKVAGNQRCVPDPAYRSDIPSDAVAMLAYLQQRAVREKRPILEIAADVTADYLRPRTRAAFFHAVARVEGAEVVEGVKDAAGRVGVAVVWRGVVEEPKGQPTDMTLIFDSTSFSFIGTGDWAVSAIAIVDKAGQLP